MEEVDWSSLHKILSDVTRRNILELLAEKEGGLSYTEIMALLRITNTGRLNYHLKALSVLVSKDDQGRYRLTERGKLAANLLKTFPERVPLRNKEAINSEDCSRCAFDVSRGSSCLLSYSFRFITALNGDGRFKLHHIRPGCTSEHNRISDLMDRSEWFPTEC